MKATVIRRMVLDESVTVAWCYEDESTGFTEGVLDLLSAGTEVLTPAIWPFEVANALLAAERRKRITLDNKLRRTATRVGITLVTI